MSASLPLVRSRPGFLVELDPAVRSLWLCDNRLIVQVGPEGPRCVNYLGPRTRAEEVLSARNDDFFECLRPSLKIGALSYAAEEGRFLVAPFGCCRRQKHPRQGFELRTGIWLAEDSLIFSFDVTGPVRGPLQAEVVIWPQCFSEAGGRRWRPWRRAGGTVIRSGVETCPDRPAVTTSLAVAARRGVRIREYREPMDVIHSSGKFRLATAMEKGRTAFLVVAVGRDAGETARRARRVARAADGLLRAQFRRYAAAAARAPRCRSRSPLLDRFVRCAPLYEEALKVSDTPGARRAKTSTYWVWLWDAILPALVDPWVGDGAFAAATARFFARYLHPRTGAPFAFPYDLSTLRVSPPGSRRPRLPRPEFHMQGLVEILAHDTAALSADASLLPELYPALRPHFESMAATTVGSTGLLRGRCAFPDARPLFDETGETVSGENNGVWYNACRKMERMALRMNDPATAHLARETALAIERHFWRLLWNRREQCLAGAAHPAKGQTDVFPSTSAFWDFGYGDELCDGYQRRLVAYHLKHFYSPMGITFLSPFRPRLWDRDGNQFHCSWPVLDSHMLKLALWAQNAEALRQFLPWLESLMARHTVPEAIQMRVWKDHPVVYDPGAWQAYTISSWYRVVVECLLGVTLDEGGVTLTGTPAAPMALRGLHYRGTRLDIETRGRGWNLASLTLDGVKLLGTNKIAAALLRGRRHRMVVTRSAQPSARWHVVRANGSSVGIARAGRDALAFTLTGTGLSRVLLYAPGLRRIRHNGQAAAARRAERPGCWWFETVFEQAGAEGRIEAEGI